MAPGLPPRRRVPRLLSPPPLAKGAPRRLDLRRLRRQQLLLPHGMRRLPLGIAPLVGDHRAGGGLLPARAGADGLPRRGAGAVPDEGGRALRVQAAAHRQTGGLELSQPGLQVPQLRQPHGVLPLPGPAPDAPDGGHGEAGVPVLPGAGAAAVRGGERGGGGDGGLRRGGLMAAKKGRTVIGGGGVICGRIAGGARRKTDGRRRLRRRRRAYDLWTRLRHGRV